MKDRAMLITIALLLGGILFALIYWHVQDETNRRRAYELYMIGEEVAAKGGDRVSQLQAQLDAVNSGKVK